MVTASWSEGSGRATTARALMHEWRLIGRRRRLDRRRRPRFSSGRAPERALAPRDDDGLGAEPYLIAAIDCCTREIVGWQLELRCPREGGDRHGRSCGRSAAITPGHAHAGHPTTDPRSPPERSNWLLRARDRASRIAVAATAVNAESQALIESWFSKLKDRCIWLNEFQTSTRRGRLIATHIDGYHHRPATG